MHFKIDQSQFQPAKSETDINVLDQIHINSTLTKEQNYQLDQLLEKHKTIFSTSDTDIGKCNLIKHRIDLTNDILFKQRHRRIPPAMIEELRSHLEQLLAAGVIKKNQNHHGPQM